MKKIICVLVIALIGVWVYFHFCDRRQALPESSALSNRTAPQAVAVQKVQAVPLTLSRQYVGFVLPIKSVEVRPFIEGFIQDVLVQGGDNVDAGQTLFVLQQDEYLAQMDEQLANVMSSSATLKNAKTYYERLQNAGDKAVSQSDLDKAKADFLTATAAVGSAVAAYDSAKVMYDYTFINAPIAGVLGNVTATKGQYVAPAGDVLGYLVQPSPMRVVFSISNAQYLEEKRVNPNHMFANRVVKLKLADGSIYDISGKVEFLDNQVTASTASVQVYADFENPHRALLANAYVDVLVEEKIDQAVVVPQHFVSMTAQGAFVWSVDLNGILHKKPVTIASQAIENNFYLVTSGLKAGDFVVTQKPNSALENKPVQIKLEPSTLPQLDEQGDAK